MKRDRRSFVSIILIALGIGLNVACFVAKLDEFWCGLGTAFVFVGILQLFRWWKYSRDEEYREKVNVEAKDERNRYIAAKAWAWAGYLFVMICAISSIVLRMIGQDLLSLAASGAVCLVLVLYWVSYFILKRKY